MKMETTISESQKKMHALEEILCKEVMVNVENYSFIISEQH